MLTENQIRNASDATLSDRYNELAGNSRRTDDQLKEICLIGSEIQARSRKGVVSEIGRGMDQELNRVNRR